jgi:hypothetical protein
MALFSRCIQYLIIILLLSFSLAGLAAAQPAQTQWDVFQKRPVPLGVSVSNNQISTYRDKGGLHAWGSFGTLGGIVQDLSANTYLLSAAHVLSENQTGWYSGSQSVPVAQPVTAWTPNFGYPNGWVPDVVANLTAT